jgi:hypothetical protein
MREFFQGPGLWENICGGFLAAILFAVVSYLLDQRKEKRKHQTLQELIDIMGKAIKHRNKGELLQQSGEDYTEWIKQAKGIEKDAVLKARELSTTAGSLVEWLDRVPPWDRNSELERYISILTTVIDRIRGLMERNS